MRVWKTRASRDIASAKGFLFKIAQRLCLDFLRKQRNSPINTVEDLADLSVITEGHDAADAASLQEKICLLAEAMVTLSPRNREVIMHCKIERLKRKEVAARLGVSESTVDEHLSRALTKLEEFMRARGVDGVFGK